jgi:hypothetical protein
MLPSVEDALVRRPPVRVERPVTPSVEERVAAPFTVMVLKVAPLVALKRPPMVVEAVTANVPVDVAPVVVSPPLKARRVDVALPTNG